MFYYIVVHMLYILLFLSAMAPTSKRVYLLYYQEYICGFSLAKIKISESKWERNEAESFKLPSDSQEPTYPSFSLGSQSLLRVYLIQIPMCPHIFRQRYRNGVIDGF